MLGNTGKWRPEGLLLEEIFCGSDNVAMELGNREGEWRKILLDIGSSPRKDAGTNEKQDFSK